MGYRSLAIATALGLLLVGPACKDSDSEVSATGVAPNEDCEALPVGSRLPRFGVGEGRLILSYLITDAAGNSQLMATERLGAEWTEAKQVAEGQDWFVNWADFPSVKPVGDGLFYHYLVYSGEGTYDYDVNFGLTDAVDSTDRVLHNDGVAAEHGFVSSAPTPDGGLRVTWLDGRHTAGDGTGHDHGGTGGAMTLRTAVVSQNGEVSERTELDHRVCDCCNTATVVTQAGALVVYRDRSEEEIRDISFVRQLADGSWTEPKKVHDDGWQIAGCPVNGPALAANEAGAVATAWYTAEGERPRIQFARYDRDRQHFGPPILLDDRDPVGRVDLKIASDGTAYVLGVSASASPDRNVVHLWTIDTGGEVQVQRVGEMNSGREAGFPRLALDGDKIWVAYTDVSEERVRLCGIPGAPG